MPGPLGFAAANTGSVPPFFCTVVQRSFGPRQPVLGFSVRTIGGGGRHATLLPGAFDALNCFYAFLHRPHTAASLFIPRTLHRWAAVRPTDGRMIGS